MRELIHPTKKLLVAQGETSYTKHMLAKFKTFFKEHPLFILTGLTTIGVIAGLFARFHNIFLPDITVFDETTFVGAANGYIHHIFAYQDHPPFAIYIISLGIRIFGDTPIGWRLPSFLTGVALIALATWISWQLFRNKTAALLTLLCFSLDGLFIIYSRYALLDIFLATAVLLTFWAAYSSKSGKQFFLWTGIALGVATAIKYNAAFILPALFYLALRRKWLAWFIPMLLLAIGVYASVLISAQLFTHAQHPLQAAWDWQRFSLNYQENATVPGAPSPWYSWPFATTPLLLDGATTPTTTALSLALPNPLLAWSSALVFILSSLLLCFRITPKSLTPESKEKYSALSIAAAGLLIGWAFVGRSTFIYHYLTAYLFIIILTCGIMSMIGRKYAFVPVLFALIVLISGLIYLPVWTMLPIQKDALAARLILPDWKVTP